MNFIFIFISSSDPNLVRKKSVKQKIKKLWPKRDFFAACLYLAVFRIYIIHWAMSPAIIGFSRYFGLVRNMQYAVIFDGCRNDNFSMKIFDIVLIFAQNIDCGYTLKAVLTHNLCFREKIRK